MVKEYKVKEIKEPEITVKEIEEEGPPQAPPQEPTTKKGFSVPAVPTNKICKVVSDRQMMQQMPDMSQMQHMQNMSPEERAQMMQQMQMQMRSMQPPGEER